MKQPHVVSLLPPVGSVGGIGRPGAIDMSDRLPDAACLKVVIGIPTYKRPAMLDKLLCSVMSSDVAGTRINEVCIVVMDNDEAATAEEVTQVRSLQAPPVWSVHYRRCPQKGLTNVRNALLSESLAHNPDLIAFVDDDQFVSPGWLRALVDSIERTDSDFAIGPVVPVHDPITTPELRCWFRAHDRADAERINYIETNNLIMRARFVAENSMRFDLRFNTTGAEDTYFGVTALKLGARIVWAREAVAFETIPPQRASLPWLMRRRFRVASTYTYILVLERQYAKLLKKAAVSVCYGAVGLVGLPLLALRGSTLRYHGVLRLAEALGAVAGLLHLRLPEYAGPR